MEKQQSVQPTPESILQPINQEAPVNAPPKFQGKPKNWSIIILVLLFLLALGVAGYFAYQNNQLKKGSQKIIKLIPSPKIVQPSPPRDETADWNNYTNEEFEYSIKYPPNLYLTEANNVLFTSEPEPEGGWGPGPSEVICVSIFGDYVSNDFDALYKAEKGDDVVEAHHAIYVKITKLNNLKFGNYDAVEYINDGVTPPKGDLGRGPVGYSHVILIKKNSEQFLELINTSMEVEKTKQRDPIFNQMVSTLQIM